jgi:N4-gp56 family major capsid protein
MANEFNTTAGSGLYANAVQEALYTFNEASIAAEIARVYDITGSQGKTVQVPVYGKLSATSVADGTDLSNSALTASSVDISVGEYGVMTTVTDLMAESAGDDVYASVGRQIGGAVAEKVDELVFAEFANFTNTVGGAGVELTPDLLLAAHAKLRAQNAVGELIAVVHPYQAYNLTKSLADAGYSTNANSVSELGNEALRAGFVTEVFGIKVYQSSLLPIDVNGDAVAGVFTRDALGLAMKRDIRLESQRDASLRATEWVATVACGAGTTQPTYGVAITADATI